MRIKAEERVQEVQQNEHVHFSVLVVQRAVRRWLRNKWHKLFLSHDAAVVKQLEREKTEHAIEEGIKAATAHTASVPSSTATALRTTAKAAALRDQSLSQSGVESKVGSGSFIRFQDCPFSSVTDSIGPEDSHESPTGYPHDLQVINEVSYEHVPSRTRVQGAISIPASIADRWKDDTERSVLLLHTHNPGLFRIDPIIQQRRKRAASARPSGRGSAATKSESEGDGRQRQRPWTAGELRATTDLSSSWDGGWEASSAAKQRARMDEGRSSSSSSSMRRSRSAKAIRPHVSMSKSLLRSHSEMLLREVTLLRFHYFFFISLCTSRPSSFLVPSCSSCSSCSSCASR